MRKTLPSSKRTCFSNACNLQTLENYLRTRQLQPLQLRNLLFYLRSHTALWSYVPTQQLHHLRLPGLRPEPGKHPSPPYSTSFLQCQWQFRLASWTGNARQLQGFCMTGIPVPKAFHRQPVWRNWHVRLLWHQWNPRSHSQLLFGKQRPCKRQLAAGDLPEAYLPEGAAHLPGVLRQLSGWRGPDSEMVALEIPR